MSYNWRKHVKTNESPRRAETKGFNLDKGKPTKKHKVLFVLSAIVSDDSTCRGNYYAANIGVFHSWKQAFKIGGDFKKDAKKCGLYCKLRITPQIVGKADIKDIFATFPNK